MTESRVGITVTELKRMCKDNGVKGYSKKSKSEIVNMLINATDPTPELQKVALLTMVIKDLKRECKKLKIRGYSKKKKNELVNLIYDEQQAQKNIESKVKLAVDNFPSFLIDHVIIKIHNQIRAKDDTATVASTVKLIEEMHPSIEKTVKKMLMKEAKRRRLGAQETDEQKTDDDQETEDDEQESDEQESSNAESCDDETEK